mgnify:CR=1 FL=1
MHLIVLALQATNEATNTMKFVERINKHIAVLYRTTTICITNTSVMMLTINQPHPSVLYHMVSGSSNLMLCESPSLIIDFFFLSHRNTYFCNILLHHHSIVYR